MTLTLGPRSLALCLVTVAMLSKGYYQAAVITFVSLVITTFIFPSLLDSDGARVGSIAGPSPEELVGMAAQVKEVVPQASDAVIRAVLERTQSTEATIATLMQLDQSGRLPTSPAAGGSSAAGGAASSNGSGGGDGGGAAATSSPARGARISPSASPVKISPPKKKAEPGSFQEKKEIMYEEYRTNYIKKFGDKLTGDTKIDPVLVSAFRSGQ